MDQRTGRIQAGEMRFLSSRHDICLLSNITEEIQVRIALNEYTKQDYAIAAKLAGELQLNE